MAGSFKDYERVREIVDQLTALGYQPSYDWTRTDEFGPDGHPIQTDPHALPSGILREYAENDLEGVYNSNFMVVLADRALAGAWIEMGYALCSPMIRDIYVIDPIRWTIFLECGQVHVLTRAEFDEVFK